VAPDGFRRWIGAYDTRAEAQAAADVAEGRAS
jgi:hypothetical protein